jgi:hypothetical protein
MSIWVFFRLEGHARCGPFFLSILPFKSRPNRLSDAMAEPKAAGSRVSAGATMKKPQARGAPPGVTWRLAS